MSAWIKTAVFWAVMVVTAVLLWRIIQKNNRDTPGRLTYTEFHQNIIDDNIERITITNSIEVAGRLRNGESFQTALPSYYPGVIELLSGNGVTIDVKSSSTPAWLSTVINASPFLILLGFWIFMMRQMKARGKTL